MRNVHMWRWLHTILLWWRLLVWYPL